jgi:hypothetical protein
MSSELRVYASFLKDILYSISALVIFWTIRYPTWYLFTSHGLIWLAAFFFYSGSNSTPVLSTLALITGAIPPLVDAFVILNTACYLPGTHCCVPGETTAPFSLGFKTCGLNDRNETESLIWIALFTILVGILTNTVRIVNIAISRPTASVGALLAALYLALKVYVLNWAHLKYTWLFYTFTYCSIGVHFIAWLCSSSLNLVSVSLLASALLVDVLTALTGTPASSFAKMGATSRHLLAVDSLPQPDRGLLTRAALLLEAEPGESHAALAAFFSSVRSACDVAHAGVQSFTCQVNLSDLQRRTEAGGDPAFAAEVADLDRTWDGVWAYEKIRFAQANPSGSVWDEFQTQGRSSSSAVPHSVSLVWTVVHCLMAAICVVQIVFIVFFHKKKSKEKTEEGSTAENGIHIPVDPNNEPIKEGSAFYAGLKNPRRRGGP